MTTTTEQTSAERLFHRFLRHVLSDPAESIDTNLWATDVVIEVPFAPGGMRRIEGRDRFLALAEEGRRALPVRLEEVRDVVVHRSVDPDVVIGEYELAGTLTATGQPASARFISVLTAGNGQIVHWREYQDTLAMLAVLGSQPA
ncbi:nuclear transport factor 2 family protein [Nocardia xishanensis]|uniref:nuclear transport factor 2 family protein n=1 Tax=Nocardia xishanensis TaxID=238964 RepID=UPI000830D980|nr:nuclear transport factor 2 family protein [Nocardia xishanensis]